MVADVECGEILASLAAEKTQADKKKVELGEKRKQEGDELKNLGLKIIDLRTSIRGLKEEITKEEARLPQIEDLKKAAALAKVRHIAVEQLLRICCTELPIGALTIEHCRTSRKQLPCLQKQRKQLERKKMHKPGC